MRIAISPVRLLLASVVSAALVGGVLVPAVAVADGTAVHAGQVTTAANGVADIEVSVLRDAGAGWVVDQVVQSDEQGYYSFTGDTAEIYRLKFHDPRGLLRDQYWNNKTDVESADDVRVGMPRPNGGRTEMAGGSQISGRVTNESGSPVSLATVTRYLKGDDGRWAPQSFVQSDDRGYFLFSGIAAGTYRLGYTSGADTGYVEEFSGDAASVQEADDVLVGSAATVVQRDAVLTAGGRIRGTVHDESARTIAGVPVQLYRGGAGGWNKILDSSTEEDGTYSFGNLATDVYRVGFGYKNGRYVPVFWDGADTIDSARDIPVTVRETTVGHDITLLEAQTIGYWTAPTIVGTRRVGSPLTIEPGVWEPDDVTLTYQWVGSCSQCAIPGATSSTYTPTAEYVDRTIGVEITASRQGYVDRVVVPEKFAVLPAVFDVSPTVTVAGSGDAERPLAAVVSSWSPVPDTVRYQWFVGDRAEPGATQTTFVPPRGAVGRLVRVQVTAAKAGFTSSTISSSARLVDATPFARSTRPTVRGTAKVGRTLKASIKAWSPQPQRLSYRWYANGRAIARATGPSYKIAKKYRGKRISVRVTAHAAGYDDRAEASKPTAKVKK